MTGKPGLQGGKGDKGDPGRKGVPGLKVSLKLLWPTCSIE